MISLIVLVLPPIPSMINDRRASREISSNLSIDLRLARRFSCIWYMGKEGEMDMHFNAGNYYFI